MLGSPENLILCSQTAQNVLVLTLSQFCPPGPKTFGAPALSNSVCTDNMKPSRP